MSRVIRSLLVAALLGGFLVPGAAAQDAPEAGAGPAVDLFAVADVLTPAARRAVAAVSGDGTVRVIVSLDDQLDLAVLAADGLEEGEAVAALQEHAAREQALIRLLAPIWALGPSVDDFEPFWIVNGFAITARPDVIAVIAGLPGVREIDVEHTYVLAGTAPVEPVGANVARVNASAAWAQGYTGEGVVVAVLDTGVDMVGIPGVFPSEVAGSYRGGANSWFDPYAGTATPYDLDGHGTAVTSIITGGGQSGSVVGVAPGATWIAAKVFDDAGLATTSGIRASLQWVLDPDGDPSTDDGADVVNASWTGAAPGCDLEFAPDIAALRAAGVLPVFAAGNHGPLPASAPSPANLPGVLAVGALDASDVVLASSSRGPTECGGATRTYPHIAAPGEGVVSQGLQGQFVPHAGTSFAAPHVAGAAAVLTEAVGGRDADRVEAALVGSARDIDVAGPDDRTGAGVVDVAAAVTALGLAPQPTVGSIVGSVRLDVDRSGGLTDGDLPTSAVQLSLLGPGVDGVWDTADDALLAETVTGPDGTFRFVGLAPGSVRVRVDEASLPVASTLVGFGVRDVTIVAGAEQTVEVFWQHPLPGSVSVSVVDDGVGSGGAVTPLADVSVEVDSAGPDALWGTTDDETRTGLTDTTGTVAFADVPAGPATVTIDRETLPEGGYVAGAGVIALDVISDTANPIDVAVRVPTERVPLVMVSTKRAGSAGALPYRDEDVLAWDGFRFTMFFDGSDVGLAGRDVDAVHIIDGSTLLLSVDRPIELPDVGLVGDGDIVRFDATQLGEHTRGTFALAWRGADAGLAGPAADVDAITIVDGAMAVSFRGNVTIDDRLIRDEDVVAIAADGSIGATVLDGSEVELESRSEDVDAAAHVTDGWWVSTLGAIRVTGLSAGDGDVLACPGPGSCRWSVTHAASTFGLPAGDLDALSLPGEEETS